MSRAKYVYYCCEETFSVDNIINTVSILFYFFGWNFGSLTYNIFVISQMGNYQPTGMQYVTMRSRFKQVFPHFKNSAIIICMMYTPRQIVAQYYIHF